MKPTTKIAICTALAILLAPAAFAATGTLMPSPYQTVLDSNGDPVNAAKVCTYTAGTTTPLATYSDSALTIPNANPIRTDSAGRFVAWLTTGLTYKIIYQDSTGTAGVCDGAVITTVDNILAVPGVTNPTTNLGIVDVRLSLTSGTPVTTSDVTAATTIYVTLYKGNRMALYDGSTWNLREVVANTPITVPATTSQMYDVFAYDNATVVTFETLAWTNDTTRATALTTQDGVLVKSGSATRRYIGSFRTTTVSGQTEDSFAKRFLWNYYNRVRRPMRVIEATDSWTYTLAVFRQANANTANQLAFIVGWAEVEMMSSVVGIAANTTGSAIVYVAVGFDSTSAMTTGNLTGLGTANTSVGGRAITAEFRTYPAVGFHFAAWLEYSDASGTTTWNGDGGLPSRIQTGIHGVIEG
jgi:hypothetical protein